MATSLSSNLLPFHALLKDSAKSLKNSPIETLQAVAERRGEGMIASNGAFVALTGEYTGRSPKDKAGALDQIASQVHGVDREVKANLGAWSDSVRSTMLRLPFK